LQPSLNTVDDDGFYFTALQSLSLVGFIAAEETLLALYCRLKLILGALQAALSKHLDSATLYFF
jgi:hypothetical protein